MYNLYVRKEVAYKMDIYCKHTLSNSSTVGLEYTQCSPSARPDSGGVLGIRHHPLTAQLEGLQRALGKVIDRLRVQVAQLLSHKEADTVGE